MTPSSRPRVLVAPSLLAADFGRIAEEAAAAEAAGADWLHLDVMDGRFVPEISFGPRMVAAVRRATRLPLNLHLMIEDPERHLEAYVEAGADHVLLQSEPGSVTHLHRALQAVKRLGRRAGAVVDPATPLSAIEWVLPLCDVVLIMTVNPGAGGQAFLPEMLPKIRRLKRMCDRRGTSPLIAVDGGVDAARGPEAVRAGADAVIAGTAVFGTPDYGAAVRRIRAACEAARDGSPAPALDRTEAPDRSA